MPKKNNKKKTLSNAAITQDCSISPTAINHDFEKVFFPEVKKSLEPVDIDLAFWQSFCLLDDEAESTPSLIQTLPNDSDLFDLLIGDEQENLASIVRTPLNDSDLLMIDEPIIGQTITATDPDDMDFRTFLKIKFANELVYLRQPVTGINTGLTSQNDGQPSCKRYKSTKTQGSSVTLEPIKPLLTKNPAQYNL